MGKKKKNNDPKTVIEEYLMTTYGKLNDEWKVTINLLCDNLKRLKEVKASIEETGIFDTARYKKNPLLATEKDLHATIAKQCQALTLTPYMQMKLGATETDDNEDWLNLDG